MSNLISIKDFSDGTVDRSNPEFPSWEGTGVFDLIMKAVNGNIQTQYETQRLVGPEYANVYLGAMQSAIEESMKYVLAKPTVEKNLEAQDAKIAIDDMDLIESSEKWQIQKQVLMNQVDMSSIDLAYKEKAVLKDLELKDKQIESADADIAFNESKKTIMEYTRNDNIRAKAAEQFAEFLKYISAANVVPGANDFINMRALITAMNNGLTNPNAIGTITTTGADYVKP